MKFRDLEPAHQDALLMHEALAKLGVADDDIGMIVTTMDGRQRLCIGVRDAAGLFACVALSDSQTKGHDAVMREWLDVVVPWWNKRTRDIEREVEAVFLTSEVVRQAPVWLGGMLLRGCRIPRAQGLTTTGASA